MDDLLVLDYRDEELYGRDLNGVPCSCNGYADKAETTSEEDSKYGCGRRGCCCGAYKCRLCGKRIIVRFQAPELE